MESHEFNYLEGRIQALESAVLSALISVQQHLPQSDCANLFSNNFIPVVHELELTLAKARAEGKLNIFNQPFNIANTVGNDQRVLGCHLASELMRGGTRSMGLGKAELEKLGIPVRTGRTVVEVTFNLPQGVLTATTSDYSTRFRSEVSVKTAPNSPVTVVVFNNYIAFTEEELSSYFSGLRSQLGLEEPIPIDLDDAATILSESALAEYCVCNGESLYASIKRHDLDAKDRKVLLSMWSENCHLNGVNLKGTFFRMEVTYCIGSGKLSLSSHGTPITWEALPPGEQQEILRVMLEGANKIFDTVVQQTA